METIIKRYIRYGRIRKNMRKVKVKDVTIISQNCIGGVFYHDMGQQFLSPTINLYFEAKDFMKFVLHLKYYLSLPLEMYMEEFPVGKLGDITIWFLHYDSCQQAEEDWNRRKERIKYDKILVLCTDRDGFDDEAYQMWREIKYTKLLFTSKKKYEEDALYYRKYSRHDSVQEIIFSREFYKNGVVVKKFNALK